MTRSLIVIFTAIVLDAVGIGLIFPILPSLLQEITHADNIAPTIGAMTALYAVMQFIFAPVLGALSDRLGRRPVLLLSLAGAAVNYLFLALAPNLLLLFIGRAVAGLTSANVSVATAYITDISPEEKRARRFGLFNAMFGLGFIIGPVLGGVLGDHWLRLPFIAAAALNGANLLLACFILPESRRGSRARIDLAALNPLRPLRSVLAVRSRLPVVILFFIFSATGEAYGTCWALWGSDAFRWNGLWVGLSLGAFGICQTLAQALLPGPAVKLLGERGAILTGVAGAAIALFVMALAERGWMIFAIMPVFALGGIGVPALQSLATRQVDENSQGQFQGVLASAVSLASIAAPLGFSSLYFLVRQAWPGAIWLSVVAVYALAVPLVLGLGLRKRETAPAS
ncbi:TCR/Tet family MFS transporter [Rhizobium sp. YTUHZ044]|uniref:TCR/Tet family MFS transporter n=1 Tax=Rhizobium sp. YTUHZ044 TaxID=2962678 RepID=UPI003DAA3A35